ncbi:MAG: two-component system LytT family response regulator [Crocinitomix sp.]|jgi:two-component system LytT family response regulator
MEQLLIVEDEQGIRETLQDILELAGYEVLTAKNGREGFDTIISKNPDLVLCDVNMPELDGFELLGAINQRLNGGIVPPFIFLTAKVEQKDVRHGMDLGADDYILKPYEYRDVLKTVRLRLDKREKLLNNQTYNNFDVLQNSFNKLAIPCDDGLELISFDKIIKCQADRAYCTFHLVNGRKILVSKPMKEFENILVSNQFMKVHKSTIVNINFAEKFIRGKSGHLVMSDNSIVPVSLRKKEELVKLLKSQN